MNHTWTKQQEWKADKYDVTEKSASKVNIKVQSAKLALTAANDKWATNLSGPLYTEDWKVEGAADFEHKPAKQAYTAKADLTVTSPDISGAKAFVKVSKGLCNRKSN